MEIRPICEEEQKNAIDLIWNTFLKFEAPDYSTQGVKAFYAFLSDENTLKSLEFFGAFENNELLGVIATRHKKKHISCFFVLDKYQGQGIGKKLWKYVKERSEFLAITVNSSPYAVEIYHKLGFEDTDTEQLVDGIRYIPMCFLK